MDGVGLISTKKLGDQLPAVYRSLLPSEVLRLSTPTPVVDCGACSMSQGSQPLYRADLKCCTFYPWVPNYLVGEILGQASSGASLIGAMLKERHFLLPIGLMAPPAYQFRFSMMGTMDYGRQEELACPFLHSGQCGIWDSRPSPCTSFWCESQPYGREFWGHLGELLHYVERFLSQELLLDMGYGWSEVEAQLQWVQRPSRNFDEEELWTLSRKEWKSLWGHWQGKELEFFAELGSRLNHRGEEWLAQRESQPDWVARLRSTIQAHSDMLSGLHAHRRTPERDC